MRIFDRAHLNFKAVAKHGQPFTPSDADRMGWEAVDAELQDRTNGLWAANKSREANEAALSRRIVRLEERLDALVGVKEYDKADDAQKLTT